MALLLSPAFTADLPRIVTLINQAFRGIGASSSWNTEAQYMDGDRTSIALMTEELAAHPEAVLLVNRNETVQSIEGCVWLQPVGFGVWHLGLLAVDPSLQKSGLGREVLASAEHWVRAHGGHTVEMDVVNVRHILIAWYQRRGYTLTGETRPFPYGDDRVGIPRRDDLAFVVLEKDLRPAS